MWWCSVWCMGVTKIQILMPLMKRRTWLDEIMYLPETLALLTQEIDCEWGTLAGASVNGGWVYWYRLRANRNTLEYVNT